MINNLKEVTLLLESEDYKERFVGEYLELEYRYTKLKEMVENWDNLDFTPTCNKTTYNMQLRHMKGYLNILKARAEKEKISLGE